MTLQWHENDTRRDANWYKNPTNCVNKQERQRCIHAMPLNRFEFEWIKVGQWSKANRKVVGRWPSSRNPPSGDYRWLPILIQIPNGKWKGKMWTTKFILPAEKEKRWMINATNATMQRIDWTCEYLWMCLLATGNQHVALFYAIDDLWTLTNGSWWLISSILNKYLTFFYKKNLNKSSCQP